MYIYDNISLYCPYKEDIFQTKVVEKIKTHFMFHNPFFSENGAVCEIMWKNAVEQERPDYHITRRTRFPC
jgi:hypothetical protein